jgi:hypothetical protein
MALGQAGPEAAYVAALTAAGATVTAPQQAAISTFMSGEIAAGRWNGHKRIHFPVWGLAAANAICMKSLTSGTFTGAFLHTSRGAKSNAPYGSYFKTAGQFLAPLGISKSSYHISYMATDNMDNNYAYTGYLMQGVLAGGEQDVVLTNAYAYNDGNDVEYAGVNIVIAGSGVEIVCSNYGVVTDPMGIISCNGNGSAQYVKHRNVLGVSTKSTSSVSQSGELSGVSLTFMGSQYGETVTPATCGLLTLGTHMTTEQDSLFTAAAKTLWENVTGQSLPTL